MTDVVLDTLRKRKDRMAAIVLTAWEDDDPQFRKIVLDQVNDYFDLVSNFVDMVSDSSFVLNEEYVEKIDRIYESVVDSRRS